MLYKSLILGILFSIGIFSVKSGVGLSYYLFQTVSKRARLGMYLLYAGVYLLVFLASVLILRKIDLIRHMDVIQEFVQSGMLIHLIMAAMLMIWGGVLLKRDRTLPQRSKGWLLLAAPCPVCAVVIFFSVGFLMTCFPELFMGVTLMLYAVFMMLNLLTVLVMWLWKKHRKSSAESLLGGAMILIAVYFFLSVSIMPQFSDADKIYRMAVYQSGSTPELPPQLLLFLTCILILFAGGFSAMTLRVRRTR